MFSSNDFIDTFNKVFLHNDKRKVDRKMELRLLRKAFYSCEAWSDISGHMFFVSLAKTGD